MLPPARHVRAGAPGPGDLREEAAEGQAGAAATSRGALRGWGVAPGTASDGDAGRRAASGRVEPWRGRSSGHASALPRPLALAPAGLAVKASARWRARAPLSIGHTAESRQLILEQN